MRSTTSKSFAAAFATASIVLAVVAALMGCGNSGTDYAKATWKRLPSLPGLGWQSFKNSEIVPIDEKVFVVAKTPGRKYDKLNLWSLEDGAWRGPLLRRAHQFDSHTVSASANNNGRLCIGTTVDRVPAVRCLAGDRLVRSGPPILPANSPLALGDFFVVGLRQFASIEKQLTTPGTPGHRAGEPAMTFLYGLDDVSANESGKTASRIHWQRSPELTGVRNGSQRSEGFARKDQPCIAFTSTSTTFVDPHDPTPTRPQPPSARARCIANGNWSDIGPPIRAREREGLENESVVDVNGTTYMGVDWFRPAGATWTIYRLRDGKWNDIGLGGGGANYWNGQGTLAASASGRIWAIRFDHRITRTGRVLGRMEVKTYDPESGIVQRAGQPLLRARSIFGLPEFAIAASGEQVYALTSTAKRNSELVIYRLD